MKIIAIGDPHFKIDNIQEVDMLIDRVTSLCSSQRPDLIVILGDLLHTHERLHVTPLNKAYEFVDKMRKIAKTIILVGNHDMCFASNTPVLMDDFSVKFVQDIKEGDTVMGVDFTPKKVSNLKSGRSRMYKISQLNGIPYTVNENHILCLKPYKNYWRTNLGDWEVAYFDINTYSVFTKILYKEEDCKTLLDSVKDVNISVVDYLNIPISKLYFLYGYKSNGDLSSINVIHSSETEYFGFEVEGNKFLLSDSTVVHNCNNQQFLSENHWMNSMKHWSNVEVVDKVLHFPIFDYNFLFCPYVPPGKFIEALNTCEFDWKKSTAIFCHQEFFGCKMGAILSVEGDKYDESYPNIISGHIHSKQTIQSNIYYCGSSLQIAFGESEDNIIPVFTWNRTNDYKLEEIDLKLPKKKIVYTDISNIENYEPTNNEDKIKITLTGVHDDFKAFKKTKKYKEIIKSGTKVVFKAKKIKEETKKESKEQNINENQDFSSVLQNLVNSEENIYLLQSYEYVVNSKNISTEDILFVHNKNE